MIQRDNKSTLASSTPSKRQRTDAETATAASTSASSASTSTSTTDIDRIEADAINIQRHISVLEYELQHQIHVAEYNSFVERKELYDRRDNLYRELSRLKHQEDAGSENCSIWYNCWEMLCSEFWDENDHDIMQHLVHMNVNEKEAEKHHDSEKNTTTYANSYEIHFEFDEYATEHYLKQANITRLFTFKHIVKNPTTTQHSSSSTSTSSSSSASTAATAPLSNTDSVKQDDEEYEHTHRSISIDPANPWKDDSYATENHDSFLVPYFTSYDDSTAESSSSSEAMSLPQGQGASIKVQLDISEAIRKYIYPNPINYMKELNESNGDNHIVFEDAEDSGEDDFDDEVVPTLVE